MHTSHKARLVWGALLAATALALPSVSHAATPAPKFPTIDGAGVDLSSGLPWLSFDLVGIGSGDGALPFTQIYVADGWADNWTISLFDVTSGATTKKYVQLGGISDTFTPSGSNFVADKADGATLAILGNGNYLYTSRDGTKIEFLGSPFNRQSTPCAGSNASTCRIPLSITRPNGLKFTFGWDTALSVFKRLATVTSSAGYSLAVQYATNSPGGGSAPVSDWFKRTQITFNNSANPLSPAPAITYAYDGQLGIHHDDLLEITDSAGRVWTFAYDDSFPPKLDRIQRPGSNNPDISYTYGTDGTVRSGRKDGVSNSYSRVISGSTATVTLANPLNEQTVFTFDLNIGRPTNIADPLGHSDGYQYDGNGRLTRVIRPESNYTQFTYDARGNVTQTRQVAKPGSGLGDIVASAGFDATCANPLTCNWPNSTTDAKGNVTDFTYDSTHGGPLTATQPAPTVGAVRPQTRYTYTQIAGATGDLVFMPTGVSACQTGSSCAGTSDETKSVTAYNNNLLATFVSRGDGTGALTATTAMTYDPRGNLLTVDGPLFGTADTTRYRYDNADQLIGIVSPDPDGAGSLKNRAIRLTYRLDGQVSKRELGTVNSQSDPDWASFAPLLTLDITYNNDSRPTVQKLSAGGTIYAAAQVSYDSAGRTDCTAVRINPATFASLPASACSGGTPGSFGPDRITNFTYDAAGQIKSRRSASGTSEDATETFGFSFNGRLGIYEDGEDNRTTFEYDGFDRLLKTRFPVTTQGAKQSSTTDYEQLGYDANANITSRRLRDATSIAFTFDALNRATLKNLPGSEPDVTYAFDNLGRLTSVSQTGTSLSFTWDALNRNLTQVGPQGTVTSAWDLASRRTQLTYPGSGLFVNYDYLVTGEVTKIRENGATSGVGVLATYAYDNLGNRTSVTFGNSAVQNFTYDPISRLASLSNDLGGSANDLAASYSYNPAAQVVSTTRTGDAYAFTGYANGLSFGTVNGLNQVTSILDNSGIKTLTHDARGNLTAYGTKSYTYSSENLLLTGPNSSNFAYDPMMRLQQVTSGSTTRLSYDSLDRIAEYDASNALLRRYVHGPGDDEPIVWYEGSGTTDRRFLSSDERGSIISVTDSTGTLLGINKYDEYGRPAVGNLGAFGYTGQAWLAGVGEWYYKARVYDPGLGRFLQTDPIGYEDSPNLYAYALNDPVNASDPLGLCIGGGGRITEDLAIACPRLRDDSTAGQVGWSFFSNVGSPTTGTNGNLSSRCLLLGMCPGSPAAPPPSPPLPSDQPQLRALPPRPDYCSSAGYAAGDFIDKNIGGGLKAGGAGIVGAGVGTALATGITGAGAGVGGSIASLGGIVYASGTAVSTLGTGIKWLSGQNPGPTAAALMSVPTMNLGPITQIVTDQTISYFTDQTSWLSDPC